jgi:polyphosphate glucokinase
MEILGIDIGGSGIKGAPVDIRNGKLLAERHRIPTPTPSKPGLVAETVRQLVQHYNWQGQVGCGFPAVIHNGKVFTASNIDKDWIGTNIVTLFTKTSGCEFHVLNDADAAGLAEMEFGAGRDQNGVVMVITVGTGIGTALFTQRKLLPNTEFGQIILKGKIAEQYAADGVRKELDLSWKKWSKRFNIYLTEIERLLWLDLIILGGGISKKHGKYAHYLKNDTKIIPAQLLNDAGIIGAALATHQTYLTDV